MNSNLIIREKEWIQNYFRKRCQIYNDFCSLNLNALNEPWVNLETLEIATCAFRPLIDQWDDDLPILNFDFVMNETKIRDGIFLIVLHDVKYLMKEQDYGSFTDFILHEYFVGLNLNQLNLPTFAGVIAGYQCHPEIDGKVCRSQSEGENSNFILYQYIDGLPLSKICRQLTMSELWIIIKIIWRTISYAKTMINFIHQDLHFSNIIIRDLGEITEISINTVLFNSRYLPVIINYRCSTVRGLNPLNIPLTSDLIDSNKDYKDILFRFCYVSGNIDLFDGRNLSSIISFNDLSSIYSKVDKLYYQNFVPVRRLEKSRKIPFVEYPICQPLDNRKNQIAEKKMLYNSKMGIKTQIIIKIYEKKRKGLKIDYGLINEYFDLMLTYNFPFIYSGENLTTDYFLVNDNLINNYSYFRNFLFGKKSLRQKYNEMIKLRKNDPFIITG